MHAIVLNTIKYSDKDLIVELLTEKDGCLSFMQRINTSKRAKIRTAWFQPLTRLDVDYDDRPTHKLKRLTTAQPLPLLTIPYEPAKTTMALFLAEFLRVTMRSEPASPLLFDYVWNSIEWLDTCRESFANFHLVFLLHLARFFGFEPNLEAPSPNCYFDLESGTFTTVRPLHPNVLLPEEAQLLPTLMRMNLATMHLFKLSGEQRSQLLRFMNNYYKLHIPNFAELKSLKVLQEVFA